MKVVYIAGKYNDETAEGLINNILIARRVAIKYWKRGYAVICPHLNCAFMESDSEFKGISEKDLNEMFLKGDLEIIKRCDILVFLPNWTQSDGAIKEYRFASKLGKEIIFEGYNDEDSRDTI